MERTSKIGILLFSIIISGCVTVNLPGTRDLHASGVAYPKPAAPFSSFSRHDVDAAWKNPKNGNVISYLSDCHDASDPALDTITQGVLGGISHLKIESNVATTHQARAAQRVLASGTVDGVASNIDLFVFKRNSCIYILTYLGVPVSFDANHAVFDQFIQGFKAP